jgi:hypothetical protein
MKKILVIFVSLFFIAGLFAVAPGSGFANPYGLAMKVVGGIKMLLNLTNPGKGENNNGNYRENPITSNQKDMVRDQELKGNSFSFGEMIKRDELNKNAIAFAFNAIKNSKPTIAIITFKTTENPDVLQFIRLIFDDMDEYKNLLGKYNGSFRGMVYGLTLSALNIDLGQIDPEPQSPQQLQTTQAQPDPEPVPQPISTEFTNTQ